MKAFFCVETRDGTKGTPAVIAVMILGAFGAMAEGKRRSS
jgi:hypothetical protein